MLIKSQHETEVIPINSEDKFKENNTQKILNSNNYIKDLSNTVSIYSMLKVK